MIRCPNCGQRTSGDFCQWCHYPLAKSKTPVQPRVKRRPEIKEEKRARAAQRLAEVEEEKKARAAQRLAEKEAAKQKARAEKQARLAAQQEAKRIKQAKTSLKQIEKTCEQLNAGKIGTQEAIQKFLELTDKIIK